MTSTAPSTYSGEYSGSPRVTHSPQPSAPSVSARTMSTSRAVCVLNDVRKGETSGIATRRSSNPCSLMRLPPS